LIVNLCVVVICVIVNFVDLDFSSFDNRKNKELNMDEVL